MAAFCDANVLWTADENLLHSKVETAVKLGYNTVIINHAVGQDALKGRRDKNKGSEDPITKSSSIRLSDEYMQSLCKKNGRNIQQFTRLTTIVSDAGQTHKLQSDRIIQDYDILAVQATSEKTFQLACQTLDIDIISMDFTEKLPFHFKRTNIGVALERGIHFEVNYSPAIRDQTARRHTISNSLYLNRIGKGKNILLSSGCEKAIDLRGPYDVANLGLLFGLTEAQAKDAVSINSRALLLHAKSRRITGTVISVTNTSDLSQKDAWKARETATTSSDSDDSKDEDEKEDTETKSDISGSPDGPPPPKKKKK